MTPGQELEAVVFEAVVFDMDGVLVDSERMWDDVRREVVQEYGGTWADDSTRAMMGMSTPEWARYLAADLGVRLPADEVADVVIGRMVDRYADGPPVLPGAVDVVRMVAANVPVGIASSSPPALIDAVIRATGLDVVRVALSSEQVGAGKPAPDVYLAAADRLGARADRCAAVEDSTNGLRAALNANMAVYAVPNPHFPPDPAVLAKVTRVLDDIRDLPGALGYQATDPV